MSPRKKSYLTVTDQFCGAGGSSIGALRAGLEIRQALNHWKLATETYATNHPNTDAGKGAEPPHPHDLLALSLNF